MTIYIINGKPYSAVSNGFQLIDNQTYYMMIERAEITHTEVIEHD
jgi:hypothetical protein